MADRDMVLWTGRLAGGAFITSTVRTELLFVLLL